MFTTLTRSDLEQRIKTAKAGERIVYHTGSIMYDRTRGEDCLKVNAVAIAAFQAYEAGKVYLTQRFLAPVTFEYMVVKKPEPHKKVKWLGCYDPNRQSMSKEKDEVAA